MINPEVIIKDFEMDNQQVSDFLVNNIDFSKINTHGVSLDKVRTIVANIEKTNKTLNEELDIPKSTVKRIRKSILEQCKNMVPPGYVRIDQNYMINDSGVVYNANRFRKVSLRPDKKGYLGFDHKVNNTSVSSGRVHRLVAKAFIPNPDNKPQVNHKDGNKQNNHVSNLEWVTDQENRQHAIDNNLFKTIKQKERARCERNNMAKLKNSDVIEIRKLLPNLSHTEIAKRYGVSRSTITLIANNKTWNYVDQQVETSTTNQ